jgi:hypothetical protein
MAKTKSTQELLQELPDFAAICNYHGKKEADYDVDKGKDAEQKLSICLRRLRLIYKTFNKGKKPNIANTDQWKYYPWAWIKKDKKSRFGFRLDFLGYVRADNSSYLGARPYLLDSSDVEPVFNQYREEHEQMEYYNNLANQE